MFSFIHISDLHTGKKWCGYNLYEDQEYILNQIIGVVSEKRPDAVFIAGDVYDSTMPSEASTGLLSKFITNLSETGSEIFLIKGNHDPAEKLSYLSDFAEKHGVHIVTDFEGALEKRSFRDADIYMLPYVRIADGRRFFPEAGITSMTDVMNAILGAAGIDSDRLNILIAHQYVAGAVGDESEMSMGGEAPVSSECLNAFDYVALGHIHRAQCAGDSKIRYSGSPLKYSVKRTEGDKVILYGEFDDEKELSIEEIKLQPLRNVIIRKGAFDEIMAGEGSDDFVRCILTDEIDIPDAAGRLYKKFPYLLGIEYSRLQGEEEEFLPGETEEEKLPFDYFCELFRLMTRSEMTEEEAQIVGETIEKIWGNK